MAAHLAGCPECRAELAAFAGLLAELQRSVPEPPALHWGRYRADLRTRLEDDARPGVSSATWWWTRPFPFALSAVLAGALIVFAVSGQRPRGIDTPPAFDDSVGHLELLETYPVVERLDLLENLDVIKQLDRLAPSREG